MDHRVGAAFVGGPATRQSGSTRSLRDYEPHADDMEVELVPRCGHFIADERPDVVAEQARSFLAWPRSQLASGSVSARDFLR
jgi:pimeloyl-ACP methyl ester carboxylesterase